MSSIERDRNGTPLEFIKLNKEKNKTESKSDIITYKTLKNIGETLIRTSEEFGSQKVYGGAVGTFYIPEYAFDEKIENKIVKEIQ